MSFRRALFPFTVLFLASIATASASDQPPREVIDAANRGIDLFLKNRPVSDLAHFGFVSLDEVAAASLGEGFRIYSIPPDRILTSDTATTFDALVVPSSMWQFVILNNGKAACLITIDNMNGEWLAVSIGSAGLAEQVGTFLDSWPREKGYDYRLIRVYQASSEFIELFDGGLSRGVVPFTSARVSMTLEGTPFDTNDLYGPAEVIRTIRPAVRHNLETNP